MSTSRSRMLAFSIKTALKSQKAKPRHLTAADVTVTIKCLRLYSREHLGQNHVLSVGTQLAIHTTGLRLILVLVVRLRLLESIITIEQIVASIAQMAHRSNCSTEIVE